MSETKGRTAGRRKAGFPRSLRLLRRGEFRLVFDHGRSCADARLVIYARPRPEGGPSRLGLVIGRKFGDSPMRNAWKRRVREAFRTRHAELPESHDLVVLPFGKGPPPSFSGFCESLLHVAACAERKYTARGPR